MAATAAALGIDVQEEASTRYRCGRMNGGDMFEALGLLAAKSGSLDAILWIISVVLVIAGIVAILRRPVLLGSSLSSVDSPAGPGGVSIFK